MTTTVNEILAVVDKPITNAFTRFLDNRYSKKWKKMGEHFNMTHLVLSTQEVKTKKIETYSIRSIGYTVGYIKTYDDIIKEIYIYDVPKQINKFELSVFKIKEYLDNKFLGKNFNDL